MWSIWNIQKPYPERQSNYDNDKFRKEAPAIKSVIEFCNFQMEINDDENNSIEEFENI